MRKLIETDAFVSQQVKKKVTPHESAVRQVSGEARYVDDITVPYNTHYAAVGVTDVAAGVLTSLDLTEVRSCEGVIDVITVSDVPGKTDIAPVFDGDPVLLDGEVRFYGQPVFAVLAKTSELARYAATKAKMAFAASTPCLTEDAARQEESFVRPPHTMKSAAADAGFRGAPHIISGSVNIGGQEHLYLEGQVALAVPEEEDRMLVYSSSQHPSEVQKLVAEVLDTTINKVTVDMRRMGGGFGGKETQAAQWACLAAILARRNNCAVKLRLPRKLDMIATGKRHPFKNTFTVGVDEDGLISGCEIDVMGNCGHSPDLSDAIVDRAMFHADNAYCLGDATVTGYRLKTNMVSHTAFRGFGGPQGMMVAETMLDAIARKVKADPLTVRKRNFYGQDSRNVTHYGMEVEHNLLPDLIEELEQSADYWQRREKVSAFNQDNKFVKKGLALTPVKFGISFTAKHLNQAGALVHVYTDGTIQVNHGGTEMGQGLHTKVAQIAASEFGVDVSKIDVTSTRTDKVPNTSPTAASSGTDLNGKAVQNACKIIRQRISEYLAKTYNIAADDVRYADCHVFAGEHTLTFAEVVQDAYMHRVSLSSTGFYKTPKIHYDRTTGKGRPFFYFAYGASCSEVTIDTLTGEYTVDRVDILHDVGNSINPAIDIGQIEGGFIQGMGWLTCEDLRWDESGQLISNNPATYKIPAIGDTPEIFNVALFDRANAEDSIYHSKAVGEPPLMLAISTWCAIKDAIASLAEYRVSPDLAAPATPENVVWAIKQLKPEGML